MTNPTQTNVTVTEQGEQSVTVVLDLPQNVQVADSLQVNTVSSEAETVDVQELGIVGPRGPQGIQGAPGSGHPTTYALNSVSSWNQVHNLGYYPQVLLRDAEGESVEIGIEYPDVNTVYIEFPVPFTGTVTLS